MAKKHKLKRYGGQINFKPLGKKGQEALLKSSITLVGCGSSGSAASNILTRAGVGKLLLIDRLVLELGHLQREFTLGEDAVKQSLPKAIALRRELGAVNSDIDLDYRVEELNPKTAARLLEGTDLIIDSTDNMETRLLINDYSLENGIPWIYGGTAGSIGNVVPFLPGKSGCLRCIMDSPPRTQEIPSSESEGLLGSSTAMTGAIQAIEAIKILTGNSNYQPAIIRFDIWQREYRNILMENRPDCPACGKGQYDFLYGSEDFHEVTRCGEKCYQIHTPSDEPLHIGMLYTKLRPLSKEITFNDCLLRVSIISNEILIFKDGRVVIKGVDSGEEALSIFGKYIIGGDSDGKGDDGDP